MKDNKKTGSAKRRQFILRMVVIVLASMFLGVSVYTINAKRANNLLPMPFGVGAAVVISGSMEPTLKVGELVFVRSADSYQLGEIIVFQEKKQHDSHFEIELTTHRVISVEGTIYTTQGDANNTPDGPVELSDIKGKIVWSVPYIGYLFLGLQSLPGITVVLSLAVLLMCLSWRKEKDVTQKEQDAIKDEIRRLKSEMESKEQEPAQPDPEQPEAH